MRPLVTISIPTFNSAKTLRLCLSAVKKQTYRNIEINLIDGGSKDNTISLARKLGVKKIKVVHASLLKSRYEGVKAAKGKYILILDSDQILSSIAIERAVEAMRKFDMLALGENVYSNKTIVERLFQLDRDLVNKVSNLSPYSGVIMPRFFKLTLLKKAYGNIPKKMFADTGGPDHAIVYYEAWKISKKVGVVPDAVKHMEPASLRELWKKFYRWGATSVGAHHGKYKKLMEIKERPRTGLFTKGLIVESIGSMILVGLKWIPFKIGFYTTRFKKNIM